VHTVIVAVAREFCSDLLPVKKFKEIQ